MAIMPMGHFHGHNHCGSSNFTRSFLGGFLGATMATNPQYQSYSPFMNPFSSMNMMPFSNPMGYFNSPFSMPFQAGIFSNPFTSYNAGFDLGFNSTYSAMNNVFDIFTRKKQNSQTQGVETQDPFATATSVTAKTTGSKFDSSSYLSGTSLSALPQLAEAGYNPQKGSMLAREAEAGLIGFTGKCGKYVRIAMENAGIDNGQKTESAAEYDTTLLDQRNFKEISTKGLNLSQLPAGCVLVYERGVSGYSKEHGHVEITLGDGRAASDGLTTSIRDGAKVFIPV